MCTTTFRGVALIMAFIMCIGCLTACRNNAILDNATSQSTTNTSSGVETGTNDSVGNTTTSSENETANNTTTSSSAETGSNQTESSNPPSQTTTSTQINSSTCSHSEKVVLNKADATCFRTGYTGDTYCVKCNKCLEYGTTLSATGHLNTEIRYAREVTAEQDGYTGDTYCKTCGLLIATGKTIPRVESTTPGKVTYRTSNGYEYTVDEGTDITEYTMALRTKKISSPYRDIELEILRLCNEERAKAGVAPLSWYEDAYYFTHIRSIEIYSHWGHPRPDWRAWHTVYSDDGVILNGAAENLAQFQMHIKNVAKSAVNGWMSSPDHRASIMNPEYTKVCIALEYGEDNFTLCATQHFFS